MPELLFQHVTKEYEGERGLFDFSVKVEEGGSFGLLGPGSSGKSTAVSLLMGHIQPDDGEVTIGGLGCFKKRHQLMKRVGYVSRDARLPERCTGEQFMRLISQLRGGVSRKRIQELMERLDLNPLGDWAYMPADGRRKVQLLIGLMTDMDVLILDEPCAGLDANARNVVLELIAEERQRGKTVFMTSRVFEEVQRACAEVGIIREGRLVTLQQTKALSYTRQKVYHITFESLDMAADFAREWESGVELMRNRVIVAVPGSPQVLLKTLTKYTVLDLVGGREEIEDSFLRAYGGDLV